ncbi:F-box/FBD/LRR-repeat protein At1g13570-like [Lycium ferocissimum]|uniref:F-box/FBD/LRR-repeat protein At1g13570-like n=1 Tax=Lycium ferocissimum TaxID=112874 RepID=UPI00281578C0|nr:F-box/FBD/LRR-repeat protein At1g13570-like [Lycium ferocissimum]
MRLPLREAVRTSIISKKWRYNWCRVPQLKLDQTLWETTEDLISPAIGFANIVYPLLALHTGQITKFTLDIPDLKTCPNIDNLIHFLTRNGIQHFVLKPPLGDRYKLPSSFFTSLRLRHLTLQRCIIRPPPVFKGFDGLISLELSYVEISSEFLGSLISHSPLLENLVLKDPRNSNPIEISAPKLRSFVFLGNIHLIQMKNVPLLSSVSFEPTEFPVDSERDPAKIFEFVPALENLCWNQLMVLDAGPFEVIPTRLPFALNCLKRLYLSWITLREFFELSFVLFLIRSSPYLQEIEIEVVDDAFVNPWDVIDEIPASFSAMTFNHLRIVKINNVVGAGAEMQLIKVLLAKSPALLRMVIKLCEMEDKRSLKILAEITKFHRASFRAKVVIM